MKRNEGKPEQIDESFDCMAWLERVQAEIYEEIQGLTPEEDAALAKERSKTTGDRYTTEASMAKLFASEVAVRCANEGVQIHGGYGFIKDYPAEKFYRDVKLCTIGEGTSEIQRLVIARQLLKE